MTVLVLAPRSAPVHAVPDPSWAEFYAGLLARANVPDPSYTVIDEHHAVFQAMYLDLADIKVQLSRAGVYPPLITIVADVLNIPAGSGVWLTSGVLQIQARRVQVEEQLRVTLDYRTSTTAGLLLYCAELKGAVQAVAVRSGMPPEIFVLDAVVPTGGVHVRCVDGRPTRSDVSWAQGVPTELPDWFERAMRTEFVIGSLLYDAHRELAISQFGWLKSWTGYTPSLLGLFLQSSALLALLTARVKATANGTTFVPYLSRTVYGDLAKAYVDEARQYEADFRALQTQRVVDDHFLALAKSLLANKTYESRYAVELLDQARRNFDHAVAASDEAERTLSDAQLKASLVKIDFELVGVPAWRREQIAKAVIEIGTAVVTFAVGIGAMFAGDPAGGGAAAGGAIEAAKSAEKAAKTGSEIARLAKQLAETMEKLKQVGEVLAKVAELAKAVIAVAGDLDHAESYVAKMREMSAELGGADLTATYDWQIYQQAADASLADPVKEGIEFAEALKLAVDAVAVYGQARAAAQVAVIDAGQRYAVVSLQQQLARRQQAELQAYVDALDRGAVAPAALLQRFYELYLNAKTGLFTAAQGYRDSYYYWALQPSVINPSIIDGVDGLDTGLKDLTNMVMDNRSALEHFDPPPQKMTDKLFFVDDARVVSALAADGEARWVLPADAAGFTRFDRVRLTCVRIWLEGAQLPDGGTVDVRMATQGNYLDRFGGKSYQFTSKPLVRDFQYRVTRTDDGSVAWIFPNGTYGYIEVDGVVDEEVSYAYFQPTPFAEWHVKVTGDGLDLTGLTRVVMQFAGSVIPRA
jgi:hypothetical protein